MERSVEPIADAGIEPIAREEVVQALSKMKRGKSVGPDGIPAEAWKCLGEIGIDFLMSLFNDIVHSNTIPKEWRRSILVPIYKGKGDVQDCGNYRGIKLTSHTMKIWERVVEKRLRKMVNFGEGQYGFMPGKSAADAIFALRQLMKRYREGQVPLHCIFIDLEKACNRVPREEVWNCLRLKGVTESYVRLIQDMYTRQPNPDQVCGWIR